MQHEQNHIQPRLLILVLTRKIKLQTATYAMKYQPIAVVGKGGSNPNKQTDNDNGVTP